MLKTVKVELDGALRCQPNRVVLHTDEGLLPTRRRAWAVWNCERGPNASAAPGICLHYLITTACSRCRGNGR